MEQKNGLRDRIEILERILVGNVLGACRALGFEIPNKGLQIRLLENLGDMGFQRFSSQNAELHRLTFNIRWEANIDLPDGIGLGRGVSKGYGNLEKVRERARVGIKKGEREKISLEAIR